MKLRIVPELSLSVPVPRPSEGDVVGLLNRPEVKVSELATPARLTSMLPPVITLLATVITPTVAVDPCPLVV
jgi:hypothetical protein